MDVVDMKVRIKEIIANITNLDPEEIGDADSFTEDLDLDSLSLLEIGVDVDYEFKLGLPEEEMRGIDSVNETVALVTKTLNEQNATAEVA